MGEWRFTPFLFACLVAACGETEPRCVVGESAPCACPDSRSGAQTCIEGGAFGPCVCAATAAVAPQEPAPVQNAVPEAPAPAPPAPAEPAPEEPITLARPRSHRLWRTSDAPVPFEWSTGSQTLVVSARATTSADGAVIGVYAAIGAQERPVAFMPVTTEIGEALVMPRSDGRLIVRLESLANRAASQAGTAVVLLLERSPATGGAVVAAMSWEGTATDFWSDRAPTWATVRSSRSRPEYEAEAAGDRQQIQLPIRSSSRPSSQPPTSGSTVNSGVAAVLTVPQRWACFGECQRELSPSSSAREACVRASRPERVEAYRRLGCAQRKRECARRCGCEIDGFMANCGSRR